MNLIIMPLKKIAKLLFNRIFYVALALLVQLGWLFILVWQLAAYSKYISFGITVVSILSVLWIVNKKINPSYKLGWTMLIMAVPIFGLLLYILFGKSRVAQEIQEQYAQVKQESVPYLTQEKAVFDKIEDKDPSAAAQSKYIHQYSGFPVYENTTAEYFQVGDDMFPVLVKELEQAEHYIYIEYFIINDGVMWRTILDILERKAVAGVDVRLIYDGFGCLTTLP
ncbi:MAG TPA: PLDc N-terminal domain-containing protein, partial [Candidatus Blautia intestinipullorum]|nr:PLDc N-terminal domain-containing protein [Candidatus Blautia intestinipullorum]